MAATDRKTVNKTADFTAGDYYRYVVDPSGGAVIVTIPEAQYSAYKEYYIQRVGAEGNSVTLARSGSDTFTSQSLTSIELTGVDEGVFIFADPDNNRWLVQ